MTTLKVLKVEQRNEQVRVWTVELREPDLDGAVHETVECTDVTSLWHLMRAKSDSVERSTAQTMAQMHCDRVGQVYKSDTSAVLKTLFTLQSVLDYAAAYSPRGVRDPNGPRRYLITATPAILAEIVAVFKVDYVDWTEYNRKLAESHRIKRAEEADELLRQIKAERRHQQ